MSLLKQLSLRKKKLQKPVRMGKLIVLDGPDGSGKATQTQLLIEELRLLGYKVETTDFPQYGTKSAGLVEEYLNGKYGGVNPYAASIFYAVDRFDASAKVKHWLAQGKIVISNRYVTASAGHQGGKITDPAERIKFFKWLDNLEYQIFGIPKPDLNIILHVPVTITRKLVGKKPAAARKYLKGKKKDMHEADLKHQKAAEKIFLEIAKLFPYTKLVECMAEGKLLSPRQVHNKVWELVRRIALKDFEPRG